MKCAKECLSCHRPFDNLKYFNCHEEKCDSCFKKHKPKTNSGYESEKESATDEIDSCNSDYDEENKVNEKAQNEKALPLNKKRIKKIKNKTVNVLGKKVERKKRISKKNTYTQCVNLFKDTTKDIDDLFKQRKVGFFPIYILKDRTNKTEKNEVGFIPTYI